MSFNFVQYGLVNVVENEQRAENGKMVQYLNDTYLIKYRFLAKPVQSLDYLEGFVIQMASKLCFQG